MRIVCDTNVLISAFLWRGMPGQIIDLAKEGKVIIYVSAQTVSELQRVLGYPKFKKQIILKGKTPEGIINEFLEIAAYCCPEVSLEIIVKGDPADDKFLACAVAAQASFVVSGDKHLLGLKQFKGIPVVTPREFLKIWQQRYLAVKK